MKRNAECSNKVMDSRHDEDEMLDYIIQFVHFLHYQNFYRLTLSTVAYLEKRLISMSTASGLTQLSKYAFIAKFAQYTQKQMLCAARQQQIVCC